MKQFSNKRAERVTMNNCLFCKFASGELTKEFFYEDEDIMVFEDIHPHAPVHLLVVPKVHVKEFLEIEDDSLLAKVKNAAHHVIKSKGLSDKGYKITVNGGGYQDIDHLHFHLTGPHKSS